MRRRALLMLALAAVLGIAAVFLTRGFINRHASVAQATGSIVVAKVQLNFGDPLTPQNLVEVPWPAESVPVGAFGSIAQMLPPGVQRVALQPIVKGEPVLLSKVSGPGGRATLSSVIPAGDRAMTIRVNDILGVAGFVLPGDRVDIMLTKTADRTNSTTEVLLQGVRVLGIDQDANQQKDKPVVAHAITLEVTPEQAEKLTLAATVGELSLALRKMGNSDEVAIRPVGLGDLRASVAQTNETKSPQPAPAVDPMASVRILRGVTPTEYEVGIAGHGPKS